MRIQPGATVQVEASCVDEVPPLLARPGDSWYRRPGDDQPPVLCAVSGALSDDTSAAGAEVVALLEQGSAPARGERVRLGSAAVFRKPRGLSFSAAAQLMLPALTACAALQAARLPPPGSAVAAGSPPKVVVAGSTGRLPGLLTQVLRGAGCTPLVAGRAQDAEAVAALGGDFLDHDSASFAETCSADDGSCVHAVLDVLGREEAPELVQEYMDAYYVSLAPPALTRLAEEGALAALRRRWGGERESRPWLPSAEVGARLLPDVDALLRGIDAGTIAPPPLPLAGVTQELSAQYAEYLRWARDESTGLRFGFPGRDLWAVEGSGRPEFSSSQNRARTELRSAAPELTYSPRIEPPRIDLFGTSDPNP